MRSFRVPLALSILAIHACSIVSLAQDSTGTAPTSAQFCSTFEAVGNARQDAFRAIGEIVQLKDQAVQGLLGYICSVPDVASGDLVDNRLFALQALDGIATPAAFSAVEQIALESPYSSIKAAALLVLSGHFFQCASSDTLVPDKEIVHILIRNVDDTTLVPIAGRRIGQIAREGVRNWTGVDLGDLSLTPQSMKIDGATVAADVFRERWWQKISGKIVWESSLGRFEVNR